MSHRHNLLSACFLTAAISLGTGFADAAIAASDPVPGDLVAPPVNINIALLYNQFYDTGTFGAVHGSNYSHDTHISDDITTLRYIRTFELGSVEAGFQIYEPYVAFLGQQKLGVPPIGTPAPLVGAPGAGPIGPAHANLSSNNGFGQPNIGVFFFPVNQPATGTYVVIAPWISPPISGFNKSYILNPGQNIWNYELEAGFRTTLFGTPTTSNLSVELWGEVYAFGDNGDSAAVSPEVDANSIPPGDGLYGVKNPLVPASKFNATFREQPSEEFRVYLPYQFLPATRAFIAPGIFQSFGGKQTYKIKGFDAVEDSGNRTNETQLRLIAGSFVSQSTQIMLLGGYDVAAHGQPLNRLIELRVATFF